MEGIEDERSTKVGNVVEMNNNKPIVKPLLIPFETLTTKALI